MNTVCPQFICGFPQLILKRVLTSSTARVKLSKNFKTLTEAEAFRKAESRSYTTRIG